MNTEWNINSNPTLIRILLPISRTERVFRVFRLLKDYFPEIASELFLLYIREDSIHDKEWEWYCDFQEISAYYLPNWKIHIIAAQGDAVSRIVETALRFRIDLVIYAHPPIPSFFHPILSSSLIRLLSCTQNPILLLPDPMPGCRNFFPIKNILFYVQPKEASRIAPAYALKAARLLNANVTVLSIARKSKQKRTRAEFELLRDRYWDESRLHAFHIALETVSFQKAVSKSIAALDPDLIIFSLQHLHPMSRFFFLKKLSKMIPGITQPILIVKRFEGVRHLEQKYSRIYSNLSEYDLAKSDSQIPSIAADDIGGVDGEQELLLGYYSQRGIRDALKKYGFLDDFTRMGYPDIVVDISRVDRFRHRFRIFPEKSIHTEPLVDLIFRQEMLPAFIQSEPKYPNNPGPYLFIEWLCLQDPLRAYHSNQCPLPGQKYPGLGMGWKVLVILEFMAKRLGSVGLYNFPEYYHSARLFHRFFHFVSPEAEGRLLSLDRDSFPLHVLDVSWAIIHGLIKTSDAQYQWSGAPQVFPMTSQLKAYFRSDHYQSTVWQTLKSTRFKINRIQIENLRKLGKFYKLPEEILDSDGG